MMVKDLTKFTNAIWRGRGMLDCVCVCRVSLDFEFWEGGGGTPKFGIEMKGVYST